MVAGAAGLGLIAAGCNLGAPPSTYEVPAAWFRTGDVNGDGNVDIVTAGAGTLGHTDGAVLLGDGAGGFTPTVTDIGFPAQSFDLGDVDGDGDLDRVGLSWASDGTVSVSDLVWQPGDGAGGFGASTVVDTFGHSSLTTITLSDIDDDDDLDVAAYGDNNLLVWKGDGAGGFGARATFGTGTGGAYAGGVGLTAVDLDADGDDDLLGSGWAGAFSHLDVRLNDGTGAFPAQTLFFPDCGYGTPPHRGTAGAATVLDADEDGDIDVAMPCTDRVSLFRGDGAGGFGEPEVVATDVGTEMTIASADFDGDGHADLVTPSGFVVHGDGTGAFPRRRARFGGGTTVLATDLTGDGRPDVAFGQGGDGAPNTVVVYPNAL